MWTVYIKHIVWVWMLMFVMGSAAEAQQDFSRTISYQGVLVDRWTGSKPADGLYEITFRLYSDSLGEHQAWKDTYNTSVVGGVFSVLLGSGRAQLPASTELDRPLWLGVQTQNESELRPLAPLSAAPFALNVPDAAITTSKLAARSVTEDKLAVQYVRGISVDGYSVTPSGSSHFVNFQGIHGVEFGFDPSSRLVSVGVHNTLWTAPELRQDTHDLSIDPNARIIRLVNMQIAPIRLTGIDHMTSLNGRIITLTNSGTTPIILIHGSASSRLGDQLSLPGNSLVILAPNGTADFVYDDSKEAWILISSN